MFGFYLFIFIAHKPYKTTFWMPQFIFVKVTKKAKTVDILKY